MPRENKKRGRRAEKKRKSDVADVEEGGATKRARHHETHNEETATFEKPQDYIPLDGGHEEYADAAAFDRPFYGMLDEEEQEFFRKVGDDLDDMDQTNELLEERLDFVKNVFKQVEGKELKIANSQSCSRLLERLIHLASATQLKQLFQAFSGNFVPLFRHRFASHCCESLFTRSAVVVTDELINRSKSAPPKMEQLFLDTTSEVEAELGWLMTDLYASHPIRILLLVLSGQPIQQQTGKHGLHSRRKEHVGISRRHRQDDTLTEERSVPKSFATAFEGIISSSVLGLDSHQVRSLATHKIGNPMLQLLLRLELSQFGKERAKEGGSIIRTLVPETILTADSESSSFIVGLLYDPIGSRLLETILEYAPAKTFKAIYKHFIKAKLTTIARNDVASYAASKAFTRLSKEDMQEAMDILAPEIPTLVEKNRLDIIRVLIERAVARGADTRPLATQLELAYKGANGFDLVRMLKVSDPTNGPGPSSTSPSHNEKHASKLAQAMIADPGPLSALILSAFANIPSPILLNLARAPAAAYTVTAALSTPHSSPIVRRKLIAALYGHIAALSLDPSGSWVINAVWTGTHGLAFMRERVAEELAESEGALRDSEPGRRVWRNWHMDLYKRRRRDWVQQSRNEAGQGDGFVGFPEEEKQAGSRLENRHMSALERARERHAREKQRREKGKSVVAAALA